jgi:hypothetical protein
MINLSNNVGDVIRWTERFSDQVPFAVASALTATAREVAQIMPSEVDKASEGGAVPYTKQGFYVRRAEKAKWVAWVGVKDRQAAYLRYQILGGQRRPAREALRLPTSVQLTPQGNLPAGTIQRLVQRAKMGKRATKAQAKRFGVSSELDLFYGEPGDGRPAGIYKRVRINATQGQLVPVVVFPKISARYQQRFDFFGLAERKARAVFKAQLAKAWARAKATAK